MLKVVLSFDDGRKDNYRAAMEILKPLNIPTTFNITTGYVLKDIKEKDKPGPQEPMTLDELKELAECELFEIAGHGYTHDNDINNLVNGVIKLREQLPDIEIMGVASPHSEFNLNNINETKKIFEQNGIHYLRISNDYTKMGKFKIWVRRVNRFIHSPMLYAWTNKDSVVQNRGFLLHSFPVIRDNKLKEVEGLLDKLKKDKFNIDNVCILMFHSILKPGEDYYRDLFSWDYDDFQKLCNYLSYQINKKEISVIRTTELYKK